MGHRAGACRACGRATSKVTRALCRECYLDAARPPAAPEGSVLRTVGPKAPGRAGPKAEDNRPWQTYRCYRCGSPMLVSDCGACFECSTGRPRTIVCRNVWPPKPAAEGKAA